MDGVVTVIQSGGQYQVVIGNHVPDVFADVVAIGGFQSGYEYEKSDKKVGIGAVLIDTISGVFTPILGLLCATGMIKGLAAVLVAFDLLTNTSAKKFKLNEFTGMTIGAVLVYPAIANLTAGEPLYTLFDGTVFQSAVFLTFLGIPVLLMSYASSVIPVILSTYVASKIEKGFRKIIPDVVKTFLVPCFTLLITTPLAFIVIGPIATWTGNLIGQLTLAVYNFNPIAEGLFIGAFWQVLVIFGLHWD